MRKILIGLTITILLLGCMQMSAEQIAKKAEEKYERTEDMKGIMVLTTEFEGEKQIMEIKFWYKKPNKWRSESKDMLTVTNGSVMWLYNKQSNEVIITELPEAQKPDFDYGKIVKDMLEKYEIKLIGEEKVTGRDCYVMEAIPKKEKFIVKQKLWIDKEFWYPLRIEMNFGEFNSTIEYKDVEFNTGMSDEEFEFKPPEGAKIVEREIKPPEKLTIEGAQKEVNFTILTPSYTAGYEFSHAMVFKFGNKETVSLYYKKDERILTITESTGSESRPMPNATKIKIGDRDGELAEVFGSRMLRFHINGVEVIIAGKISEEELVRIAESMV